MLHPYQCIGTVRQEGQPSLLIAACGPKILSLDLQSNTLVSEWCPEGAVSNQSNGKDEDNEDTERPAKKQKTNNNPPPKVPNVIKLTVAPGKRHIVAVTDDKYVHVFEQDRGKLTELSQRVMPKRPCAIQITPDDATILVGDKFGDVYSLPLLPTEEGDAAAGAPETTPQPETQFKPSATNLTVHSKRNRDALAAQMQQKNFTPRKEALKFEHKLLLGHVSMLTDMKYAKCEKDVPNRGYIITADRDEHIRISRGPPQAHIIEGFCLGHTEFVSKICQVGESNLLLSGGGDPWLGVWQWWPEPKLRRKMNLHEALAPALGSNSSQGLVVSGIWSGCVEMGSCEDDIIVVACEKVKALLVIDSSSLRENASKGASCICIKLTHNPIDVAFEGGTMLISVDSRQTSSEAPGQRLKSFYLHKEDGKLGWALEGNSTADGFQTLNEFSSSETNVSDKELDDLLYGVADLRKRRDQEAHEAEQDN